MAKVKLCFEEIPTLNEYIPFAIGMRIARNLEKTLTKKIKRPHSKTKKP